MTAHPARASATDRADAGTPLLTVRDLRVGYDVRQRFGGRVAGAIKAVDGVSFDVASGETLGLVGESGSGKSTVAAAVTRLTKVTSGTITFDGSDVLAAAGSELIRLRRNIQIVFQQSGLSLNPRIRIDDAVAEPLIIHRLTGSKAEALVEARELLGICGLGERFWRRMPRELSGGQQQRVALARAMALKPKLIIADEPTSALDVSVQARLMALMLELQERFGVSYLLISHDLAVVRHLSSRIAVMYGGRIMETGDADQVCDAPTNPYTEALLSASPIPDPDKEAVRRRIVLTGEIPDPRTPLPGCRFHTRCPLAEDRCRTDVPPLTPRDGDGHQLSACWVR